MEVRSYYATTVEAAMALAEQELGPDALLVQSALSAPELAHLGKYEVVFAAELQHPKPAIHKPTGSRPPVAPLIDLTELPGLGPIDLLRDPPAGLPKTAFAALLARASAPHSANPPKKPVGAPPISCSPGLGAPGQSAPAVALIGPCGAGKTTTIMKLAVVHGMLVSRPVRLLAMDPQRIGATIRLQNFAELLSLSFAEFETAEDLSRALEFPFDGLTLIDADPSGLPLSLGIHPHVETQLVLRADRKTSDNLRALESFSPLSPSRLILTALDETADHSETLTLIQRSSLPVSFLSFGQRIPEDLEPASLDRLHGLARTRPTRSARSAA